MSIPNHIKPFLKNLPKETGIYQYYDKNNALLYVGKAKNLKTRVSSYFSKNHEHRKTKILVSKIQNIKYVVVTTEMDALLLENNLIKEHQPKYNVLLKDDKSYPWICIKNELFPRVVQTRIITQDGSAYFGPYSSSRLVKTILEFFHQLYPLRTCSLNLTAKNINSGKFSVCLEYHLKNCLGPCVGNQKNKIYLEGINHIKQIVAGKISPVIQHLRKEMQKLSANLEYEKAQIIKEKITLLKVYQAKSTIVSPKINNVDVFTIVSNQDIACVNFLKINSGAIIQAHTLTLKKTLNEKEEDLLQLAIVEIRMRFKSTSKNIYCSHSLKNNWIGVSIITPLKGDKKKLLMLSLQNAKHMLANKERLKFNNLEKKNNPFFLQELKKDLRLKNLPKQIDCFDNSNIQGAFPVSACVVFKNGKPSKKDYRLFNIKTVSGVDDFASIKEVVFRRYSRIKKECKKLPELIIIDGGKGQLNSALDSLTKLNLKGKIAVISIAKRLEEIYFPGDSTPLYLDKRSKSLALIQRLRDEAHRFAIKNHRKKRLKKSLKTSLEDIPGVGPKTIQLLISHFGSTKKILGAKKEELISLVGKNRAEKIFK